MKPILSKSLTSLILGMVIVPSTQATTKKTKEPEKGNLLFILVDQLRFDALSCTGNKVIKTPNLDRLANEGVLFRTAYTSCAVSVPARASLLTGCTIYNTGITGNSVCYESKQQLTGKEPIYNLRTYDEVLIKNGYKGEYYGKWHSPEFRAYAYQNRPIGAAGTASHPNLGTGLSGIYSEWLKKVAPKKIQKPGDIFYKPMERYYAPDPLDPEYGGKKSNLKGETYSIGELRVNKDQTRMAMDSKSVIDAIERLKNNPFTIHCSYGPPHPPLLVCGEYRSLLDPDAMPLVSNFESRENESPYIGNIRRSKYFQDPSTLKYMIRNYWAMVKELDDWMGVVLATLEKEGVKDKTMIVFVADHGEMLGSHGLNGKFNFYDEAARVPFIISYPQKIKGGKVVDAPVNTFGVYATILDYLDIKEMSQTPDEPSLRRFIENPKGIKNAFAITECASDVIPGEMIRTSEWKLMVGRSPESKSTDALYDMVNDPLETKNLLFAKNYQSYLPIANELKTKLADHLKSIKSPYAEGVSQRTLTTRK